MSVLLADQKATGKSAKLRPVSDRTLIIALGALGVFPGILISYLSSAFVDNVLVKKYFDRALPIIVCFLVLNVMAFALNYFYWRMQKLQEKPNPNYYRTRICFFSAFLNALFIFLLDYRFAASCAVLLFVVLGIFTLWTRVWSKRISPEATSAVRTVLRVCTLFIGGLLIMQGRITIGEFYAVSAFSSAFFSNAISLMPKKPKNEEPSVESDLEADDTPFNAASAISGILNRKSVIIFTVLLAMMGTFSQNIYVTLQRINIKDCIPAGDWQNLLRNCLFMCAFTLCGFFARKGNQRGFRLIFHKKIPKLFEANLDNFASLAMTAILGVYFLSQIGQYNRLLASQATIGCVIAGLMILALSLSESRRKMWGDDLGSLSGMLSGLFNSCIIVYLYSVIALQITTISVGDLFVFLTVFDGLFYGVLSLTQMILTYLGIRKTQSIQKAAQEEG